MVRESFSLARGTRFLVRCSSVNVRHLLFLAWIRGFLVRQDTFLVRCDTYYRNLFKKAARDVRRMTFRTAFSLFYASTTDIFPSCSTA